MLLSHNYNSLHTILFRYILPNFLIITKLGFNTTFSEYKIRKSESIQSNSTMESTEVKEDQSHDDVVYGLIKSTDHITFNMIM